MPEAANAAVSSGMISVPLQAASARQASRQVASAFMDRFRVGMAT
jgi:hypothetical protein